MSVPPHPMTFELAPLDKWQPIETAPKDGRYLACCLDPDEWKTGARDPYDCIELVSGPFELSHGTYFSNQNSGNYTQLKFTHWMPLPEPPIA